MSTDYGYPTDNDRRCSGITQAGHQCKKHPLMNRPFCALHGGEAKERRRANDINRRNPPEFLSPETLKEWSLFIGQNKFGEEEEGEQP